MNLGILSFLYQNSLKKNLKKVLDANHQIDPSEYSLDIGDAKRCHISSACIQRSQLYVFSNYDDIDSPQLGILPLDTSNFKFDYNAISTKFKPKSLVHFMFTSFFIHLAIIFCVILSVELMGPFLLKDSVRTETTLLDVVMIDTDSLTVLPINHVIATADLGSQFPSKNVEATLVNLPKQSIFQELQQNLNLNPTRNFELANRMELVYSEKEGHLESQIKEEKNIEKNTTPVLESSNHLGSSGSDIKNSINRDKSIQPGLEVVSDSSSVNSTIKQTSEPLKSSSQDQQTEKVTEKKGNSANKKQTTQKKETVSQTKSAQRSPEFAGIQKEDENNFSENSMTQKMSAVSSNDFPNAKPIKRSYPDYPRRAAALNQEGIVTVKFDVNNNGRVTNIRILNSQPIHVFDKEVKQALRDWEYERISTKDITITFEFKMRGIVLK